MTKKNIVILHLYPKDMNIYGDHGNVLVLKKRLMWHGYEPQIIEYNPGDVFPDDVDIILGGGGQDSGQDMIQLDLIKIGQHIKRLAENNVPMLVICGMYQLFGKFFKTQDGTIIRGIGLFDSETIAGSDRMIGNITVQSEQFGDIVGYENHSGQTYLGVGATPLGQVTKGSGNNGQDGTEGAIYKNVIGSYLHGSLLPKNPKIADWIIERAATNRYGSFTPLKIDDSVALLARQHAIKRPR
jgi:CobQ-like glutamine amidotransferase family enzyme